MLQVPFPLDRTPFSERQKRFNAQSVLVSTIGQNYPHWALLLFVASGLYGLIGGAKLAAQEAVVNEGQASVLQTT
jgi:hypothetical protein